MPDRSARRSIGGVSAAAIAVLIAMMAGASDARAQIPDKFTNLQVLQKDISKGELVGLMKSFTGALGVRCTFCHDGPDNLQGMDWTNDDKPEKSTAREMLKMVKAINGTYLAGIKTDREQRVQVQCQTCHHGLTVPRPIEDVVEAKLASGGLEAAKKEYRELKEKHYGDGAYNFSPEPLNELAESLFRAKRMDESLSLVDMNIEFHPDDSFSHAMRGGILKAMGKKEEAIAAYKKALELDPSNRWAKKSLAELEGGTGEKKQ